MIVSTVTGPWNWEILFFFFFEIVSGREKHTGLEAMELFVSGKLN